MSMWRVSLPPRAAEAAQALRSQGYGSTVPESHWLGYMLLSGIAFTMTMRDYEAARVKLDDMVDDWSTNMSQLMDITSEDGN